MISIRHNITQVVLDIAARLRTIDAGGVVYDTTMRTTAETIRGEVVKRIHERGEAGDNSQIGTYSTKPMYANPATLPGQTIKIAAEGKTGKTVFDTTGAPHLTKYFASGYKELREAIGKSSDKVNLNLSGNLQNELVTIPTAKGYGLGWLDEKKYWRAQRLEAKYGKRIWALTTTEKKQLLDTIAYEFNHAIARRAN